MIHSITSKLLSPVCLAQGAYVRTVCPNLPEAAGARCGEEGYGSPLRILIAGDSAAAGVGVQTQAEALAGRLTDCLKHSYRVYWRVLAETGRTSRGLLELLDNDAEAESFDVALVSIGVNDATRGTTPLEWVDNHRALARTFAEKYQISHVVLSALPPVEFFPVLPQPLRWWLSLRAQVFNQLLHDHAQQVSFCSVLSPEFPADPTFLAEDGFHPGALAYEHWGRYAADHIRKLIA
ncbi:SGNH/GDSL hydrolase family protein [Biformimicrobium ophioploci]|uniref:SGNH/GDSL hydrolase family protein n=1 Tax=Biformimicrobium ophioploci TaxID=3036711 RepID=A0ABQ6LXT7_9GAMM|nr:SGNH/GDSL hydrolase family protein [Microbulbifer sp. NKW57]GMG86912.1 SGNH/GDSL hydrolase family protein [Microbulbifer sp. NKW57]